MAPTRRTRTHALVVDDDGLFDAAAVTAEPLVQVTILGADREAEHAENVGRGRDLGKDGNRT